MEGDLDSKAEIRPPPPETVDTGCNHHLTRSNSDASSLTAGNCEDFFRGSENVTPDECTAWTNERHNSYIYHLEMSFVKQLYESKATHCSGYNLRDINISRKRLINEHNASEEHNVLQNGCWQNINCAAGEPISGSTSADSHASVESKRTYHSKHRGMHCHPSPTKTPALLRLIDLVDLTREETGQNFLDDNNQNALNFESRAKRLKIALGDGLHQDQIASFRKCPTSDYSVINNSTCGKQLAHTESVSNL